MKFKFKRSVLAAVIAATSGIASAGTVVVTKQTHSFEGLTGVTANQTSSAISYTLDASYREGDKVTFTFPEGALVATTFPSVINMAPVNSAVEADAIAGLTLGLLNSDTKSVTYRVTKLTLPNDNGSPATEWQNGSTIGGNLVLGTVGYKASALITAPVTVTVSSETSTGDVLDNGGTRTATLAEAKTQFGTASVNTEFDGVIDVSSSRQAFVGGLIDSFEFSVANPDTTGWLNLATVNATDGTSVAVYGEAGKLSGITTTNFTAGGTKSFEADAAKLSLTYNGMVTNDTVTFTAPSGTDALTLEAQSFSADLVYNYTSAGSVAASATIATGLDAGEWTLNGAVVNIPYMPYGANSSRIIYVSNAGNQNADVSVTAFDDAGNTYDLGMLGTAGKQKVTKLASWIDSALAAKGFRGGKASITITVNAPEDDITVYSSYNIGGADRGFVNTDQYKGKQ